MDNSLGSTIEKIKLQEQDIKNKLKEKRERDAALASLNRAINDGASQVAKSNQEQTEISKRIKKLRPLLEIEKIKRESLLAQLEAYTKVYEDLKAQSNEGITKVWALRGSLCKTVQSVSDACDIWALLMRPVCTNTLPLLHRQAESNDDGNDTKLINNESRLSSALQRRKDAEAKRQKLLAEPDTGAEFIRIKNALHYSLQKLTTLQK